MVASISVSLLITIVPKSNIAETKVPVSGRSWLGTKVLLSSGNGFIVPLQSSSSLQQRQCYIRIRITNIYYSCYRLVLSIYRIVCLVLTFNRHVVYNVSFMRALLFSYFMSLGDHLTQDTRLFGITCNRTGTYKLVN